MPTASKGARLWLRKRKGRPATWLIRDGRHEESTSCGRADRERAEARLAAYLAEKHTKTASTGSRAPSAIPVADVLALYARDKAKSHARPHETAHCIKMLLAHFGESTLDGVTGQTCRAYANQCTTDSVARHDLEILRAAIRHHWKEGLCSEETKVVLPPKRPPRERWLTRQEAAGLLRAAWRGRKKRHIARFILVGLYTGTRMSAICGAALQPTPGHGWVDLDNGVFYRRAIGRKETKKRQRPVRLPPPLLAHMRRWKRLGLSRNFVVEFAGEPVKSIQQGFGSAVRSAKLSGKVTPHVLRHTAATWLMQSGVPIYEAAGYLSMTVETLESVYGHHHPDHQKGAVDAYGSHRKKRVAEQASGVVSLFKTA